MRGKYKQCPGCKTVQICINFHTRKDGSLRTYCKDCKRGRAATYYRDNREKITAANARYRQNPENLKAQRNRVRKWYYKTHYGMTIADKEAMQAAQGSKCALCETGFAQIQDRYIHVDHCHTTGRVRGILCHHCNQVLGNAKDSIKTLTNAIAYLEHFQLTHGKTLAQLRAQRP